MITKQHIGETYVTSSQALEALEDMDDYARMEASIEPIGAYNTIKQFIEQCSTLKTKANEFISCHEECEDFDGWLAFVVDANSYHEFTSILEELEHESEND